MSSIYDSIETAADLISEVRIHGLSTAQEDINRAADIFGRTSIGELDRLANDIGRNNEKGEPDPDGSWSSGRPATQSTFYSIAFSIWNWQQATAFFNEHTNPATKNHRVNDLEKALTLSEQERSDLKEIQKLTAERAMSYANKLDDLTADKSALELEITRLKARLYDITVAVA